MPYPRLKIGSGRPRALTCFFLVLLLALPAAADILCLADGRVVQDRPMRQVDGAVEIEFTHGTVRVADELIHLALLENAPPYEPKNEDEREKLAQGLVPYEGKWMSAKKRDEKIQERIAEQKAQVEEILAHGEWMNRGQEETKNFFFEYTVPEHVCRLFRERMEAYYTIFAKEWRIKPPKTKKLNVCFYNSAKEFHRTSGASGGTLAYFRFVPPYDLNVYYDRDDFVLTEQVLYHEANHYLQKLIDEGFSYPHWPGEALAEYYGASAWDSEKGKLTVGLVQEGRLAEIQDDIARGEPMGLLRMLGEDGLYEHYTWGWSLVYFLMNDKRYAEDFKKFFMGLATAKDVRRSPASFNLMTVAPKDLIEAFRDYLGLKTDVDVQRLEREWHAYIQDVLLKNMTLRGKEKAALAALATGRGLRAKRLFQEAIDGGSKDPNVYHKYAGLLSKDEKPKAIEMWHKAIELGPLNGSYYLALGRALKASNIEESKRLIALAKEIEPDLQEDDFFSFF